MRDMINAYTILVGKSERRRPFARPRRRWKINKLGKKYDVRVWIELIWLRM
jgi:hypothetical protein